MNTLMQLARFVFVGGAALVVHLLVTVALTEVLGLWYFWSFVAGTLCSWTFLFVTNALFTFGHVEALRATNYVLFLGMYAMAFLVNATLVYNLTSVWGLYYPVSIIIATAVTTLFTFTASKKFIYSYTNRDTVEHFKRLFKDHALSLLLALGVGLVTVGPFVVFQFDPAYQGLEMMASDAEEHYVARIQEVYDGHPSVGNVFLSEKDKAYGAGGLGEIIVAVMGQMFGLSSTEANVLSKFIFPFLIVLLVYALVYSMVRSRAAALIAAATPILGYNLISKVEPWLALLRGESVDSMFLVFARPINPEVSSVCLFGVLLLVYRGFYLRTTPRVWEAGSIGVLTGAALYISPYIFSFLAFTLLASFFWFLYCRNFVLARWMLAAGLVAIACMLPYLVNFLSLHASPDYAAFAMRTGVVVRHTFLLGFWIPCIALAVWFLWPKQFASARTFLLLVCVALFLIINQQVVTGFYLHPGHYHWYITKPLVAIMSGIYAGFILEYYVRNNSLRWLGAGLMLLVLFYNAALWQTKSYADAYDRALYAQTHAPLLAYLNTLPNTENVWAQEYWASLYIALYTRHNTPNNDYVIYYLNPHRFYEDRVFLRYRMQGVKPADIVEVMKGESADFGLRLFGMYVRENTGDASAISEETYLELAGKYKKFYARPYAEVFRDLDVTMVVALADDRARYDAISALRQSATAGTFVIYEPKN